MVTMRIMEHKTPNLLIDKLGGTAEVAKIFDISSQAVSKWRQSGIPDDKLIRLAVIAESRGVASRKELFPDTWQQLWPELSERVA